MDRLARFRSLVEFLCSPACGGRRTASKEIEAARGRIIDELRDAGLAPAGTQGFEQPIPLSRGINVLGRLGDPSARAILVAAHYDHLGWADNRQAYWGADDNAAGVAIMVDTARALATSTGPLKRQIIFAAFDAEEPPFFLTPGMGSQHFTHEPVVPLADIDLMICMDLVGHAIGPDDLSPGVRDTLLVLGAERSIGSPARLASLAQKVPGLHPRPLAIDLLPALSDYASFEQAEVPFLFLSCGRWEHYHSITDTPEKLDERKALAIADYLALLVTEYANAPEERVLYDGSGRDDLGTIASLTQLSAAIGPSFPRQPELHAALLGLRARCHSGGGVLQIDDREMLWFLANQMEEALSIN